MSSFYIAIAILKKASNVQFVNIFLQITPSFSRSNLKFSLQLSFVGNRCVNTNLYIIITFNIQRLCTENVNYLSLGKIASTQIIVY